MDFSEAIAGTEENAMTKFDKELQSDVRTTTTDTPKADKRDALTTNDLDEVTGGFYDGFRSYGYRYGYRYY